ncbi:MAG: Pr6Pr family membrane protein [Clostridiales bacterium]|nr:Pr6Pr family membrane protein [Clostridiales bacterium]
MEHLDVIVYRKKEIVLGIVMKLAAIIASVYGMYKTMTDVMSFTYFTNLSNFFIDAVLLVFLVTDVILLISGGEKVYKRNWQYIIKFMATISITLTFLIYLCILAPTSSTGFLNAYLQNGAGSLCVHFITPVLAILDFLMFDYRYHSTKAHIIFAVIPPLVYVAFVVIAAGLGVRWNGIMCAPYNFLNFGAPTGWFGFDLSLMGADTLGIGVGYMILVLLGIFIGIGEGYLALKNRRQKAMRAKLRKR